jgi:uncharacterized protein YigA (DUF484 family)
VDDNIAIFLVLIVSMAAALVLVLSSAWMRRTRPLAAAAGEREQVAHLASENDMLREEVRKLERQLGGERSASDAGRRLMQDIEAVRLPRN